MVIDANGVGAGLVDFMTKMQNDDQTGDDLPPFGVEGGTAKDTLEDYKKIKGPNVENDAMYLVKANIPLNSDMYSYAQTQLLSGKIRFLINEAEAKLKLLGTKKGQGMSVDQRNDYLKPYVMTSILREEMLNLSSKNDGINILLERVNKGTPKDKFSAFIYGLYYIELQEKKKRGRRRHSISDFMFFS